MYFSFSGSCYSSFNNLIERKRYEKKNRKKRPSCFFRFSISLYPFSQFNGISSCIPNVSNMYYIIDGIIMINNLEY